MHLQLGATLAWTFLDFTKAAPEFHQALTLAPGSASVQSKFAGFSAQLGHFDIAENAARRGVSLDPQSADRHVTLGQVLLWARRYDEALSAFRAAASLSPDSNYIKLATAMTLLASGRYEQALKICESLPSAAPPNGRLHCLALANHGLGRQQDADRTLQQYEARHKDHPSLEMAGVYAQWGDKTAALKTLAKAEQLHDSAFQLLRVHWELDPLRNEPEYKAIEARMNFPP